MAALTGYEEPPFCSKTQLEVLHNWHRAAVGCLEGDGDGKTTGFHVHARHPRVLQSSQREERLRIRCRTSSVRRLPGAVLPIGKSRP